MIFYQAFHTKNKFTLAGSYKITRIELTSIELP